MRLSARRRREAGNHKRGRRTQQLWNLKVAPWTREFFAFVSVGIESVSAWRESRGEKPQGVVRAEDWITFEIAMLSDP
jgi:hypothetical protein